MVEVVFLVQSIFTIEKESIIIFLRVRGTIDAVIELKEVSVLLKQLPDSLQVDQAHSIKVINQAIAVDSKNFFN